MNICFGLTDIFKQEVLAIVLSQLCEQVNLPSLFMRSVIQSLNNFKQLGSFVNGLLTRLVSKQIWQRPKLWEGFIQVVEMNFPSSLPVLLSLPKAHGVDLLRKGTELAKTLDEYLEGLPPQQKKRREFAQLMNLLSEASK